MLTGAVPWPADRSAAYRRAGYWSGETLADLGREPAREAAGRTALATLQRQVSYGQLDRWADELAGGLRALGLRAGDRAVVQLPNTPDFVALCLALFRLGVLPVLALPAHRRVELAYLCAHTEAKLLVVPDVVAGFDHRELAREIRPTAPALEHVLVAGDPGEFVALDETHGEPAQVPPPDPDDVALLLLSGGTTQLPKLIPRTHNDYAYQLRATAAAMHFDDSGVYLAALPAAHNAALGCPGVLGAIRAGGTAVLAASPSPDEVFPLIAREQVTLTTLMPAFLPLWMKTAPAFGADLSRLTIEVGGARLEPELAAEAERVLGCRLTRWFGMAEGLLSFTRPEAPAEQRHRTEGHPLSDDDEIRVVDEHDQPVPHGEVGELLTRGPYTINGYYRAEEHNAKTFTADGFFRTGDLVTVRPDGNLLVEGRIKDVVNRGGEKISAAEVEEHLAAHPRVHEAAVVAQPDPVLGERTCVFVVAATGDAPSLSDLRSFLGDRGLATYKLPDAVVTVESLPYTSIGKVHKAALRARLA